MRVPDVPRGAEDEAGRVPLARPDREPVPRVQRADARGPGRDQAPARSREPLDADIYELSGAGARRDRPRPGIARGGTRRARVRPRVPAAGRRVHARADRRLHPLQARGTRSTRSGCARIRGSSRCTTTPSGRLRHEARPPAYLRSARVRRVARDQQRRDDRLAPRLEVVADLLLRSDQRELLDQLRRDRGRRLVLVAAQVQLLDLARPPARSPSGSRRWRGSSCPCAPIPPKYRAYIGRSASAAASTSSVTISGTVAATSNSSARAARAGRCEPLVERLAVEVVVVGRVEQRQPAVAQLAGERDVLRTLGGEVDRDVARAAGGCSTSAACRARCRRATAAGSAGRRW